MAQEHNGGSGERRGHYGNGNGRGNGHYGKGRGPSRPGRGGKPGYGHEGRGGKGGFRKDFRKSDGFRAEGAGEGGEERRDFHKGPRRDFQRGGYDSLAVLTGVTNPRELMLVPAHLRPTYVARDLRALLEPARAPERTEDGGWACGGGVARGRRRAARDRGRRRRHRRSQSRSGRRLGGRGQRPRHRRHGAAGVRRAMSGATDRTDATDAPAGARPPLEKRYPGLATLSACDDEGKAKVLRDVLDGLRRELDEEQA